jgi:hypothetical protein
MAWSGFAVIGETCCMVWTKQEKIMKPIKDEIK